MSDDRDISGHYSRGHLLERLEVALAGDGADRRCAHLETLAPYDQFHGRGLEATVEIANLLEIGAADRILDIGSGIGGPARYFARRFGCRVTGIDLTAEFCDVARELTHWLGLDGTVRFVQGNALAMPFADGHFDGAYSMNVSMNIADKAKFYREIRRVLKPGGWLLLSEIARGAGAEPEFPMPWAASARTSFLSTPEETRHGLANAGLEVVRLHSTRAQALEFGARSRAMVGRGEKAPHRAVPLIHGDVAAQMMANSARALAEARIDPIEVLCRKPG
jgi:ubiquinone/menaquinone biosynthesis C-methylase UbiE